MTVVDLDLTQVHPTTATLLVVFLELQRCERRGLVIPVQLWECMGMAAAEWVAAAGPDRDHAVSGVRAALKRLWDFHSDDPALGHLVANLAQAEA